MTTYTEHQQRELDQQSGAAQDKLFAGLPHKIGPTMVSIPLDEYRALVDALKAYPGFRHGPHQGQPCACAFCNFVDMRAAALGAQS